MKKNLIRLFNISILVLLYFFMFPVSTFAKQVDITVTILPQKYFVKKIGGNFVNVSAMVLPGANPHTYEPSPKQMVNLSKSVGYMTVGMTFEDRWIKKFSDINPKMKIIETQKGIKKLPMVIHDHHEGLEEKNNLDPHIWLSPPLVKIQAKNIFEGLVSLDFKNKSYYEKNYNNFVKELNDLDSSISLTFKSIKGKKDFIVFHPSWGYFAKAYNLNQIPIEIEGKEPKPKDLENLIKYCKKNNIKIIFVQPQFSTKIAKIIAKSIGGEVVFIDSLSENWKENLIMTTKKFESVLKK